MLIDHMGFNVSDFDRSKAFYDRALAPLQIAVVLEVSAEEGGGKRHIGYGKTADSRHIQAGKPSFWFSEQNPPGNKIHIAFLADSRAEVEAFHRAALDAGGTDNGGPGVRPHYHPNYYGAFVLDPDGHNIEAVCHKPA